MAQLDLEAKLAALPAMPAEALRERWSRLPAGEVETVISSAIACQLDDPLGFAERARLVVAPSDLTMLSSRCSTAAKKLRLGAPALLADLLSLVRIHSATSRL